MRQYTCRKGCGRLVRVKGGICLSCKEQEKLIRARILSVQYPKPKGGTNR